MSRLEYLLRVHWLGRLVSLALLSSLFCVPLAWAFPPFDFHFHIGFSVLLAGLLLSRWFGIGCGGMLGLRLSGRNLRLTAIAFAVPLFVLFLWMTLILATHEDAGDSSMYHFFAPRGTPVQEIFALFLGPISMEFLFRGIFLLVLVERFGAATGIAISACAGVMTNFHLSLDTPIALLNSGLLGVLMAATVVRTRSLWFPIVFQFWWGLSARINSGVPLGGGHVRGGGLYDLQLDDSLSWLEWLSGTFGGGPESSVFLTLILMIFALLFVPRLERLRDPVLAARDFRRRLREARLAAVHGR